MHKQNSTFSGMDKAFVIFFIFGKFDFFANIVIFLLVGILQLIRSC